VSHLLHSTGCIKDLMLELLRVHDDEMQQHTSRNSEPDFLCSQYHRPNKKDAIKEKQTRFI